MLVRATRGLSLTVIVNNPVLLITSTRRLYPHSKAIICIVYADGSSMCVGVMVKVDGIGNVLRL